MAGQTDTTPEYRTIIRCTPQLEDAVKYDLIKLCGEFSAAGLISPDNASALRNSRNDEVERAARLVELVANKVKRNKKDYVLFVQVLARKIDKSMVLELEKVYRSLGGKEETGVSELLSQAADCPTIVHTASESTISSANQPPSHGDVHRSSSSPAGLCYSVSMTDDEFKRWLCRKGLTVEQDHCVLRGAGINAKCLTCLKETDVEAVAVELSIGGRAIFGDICKEVTKNKMATTSANAVAEPCTLNSCKNGSVPQIDQLLDMSHHFKVSQCLKDLPDEDLITLGCALGLSFPKLKRMRTLPSDMVAAWLRKEDNVLEHGKPTMSLLATALKRIGQNGIANSILQNVQA